MRRTLHIIKDSDPPESLKLIGEAIGEGAGRIVLIQRAVRLTPPLKAPLFVLREDMPDGNTPTGGEAADYSKLVDMIFESDSVMVW